MPPHALGGARAAKNTLFHKHTNAGGGTHHYLHKNMEKLKVFTAFSGYDSQCMALDELSIPYELVGWSEINCNAIKAHNAIYPQFSARNFGDIAKIDWSQVPDFDLFTYSSPCQDFSVAGLQRGGEKGSGTRSSLLWDCERAIVAKRPKYLLFENVSAIVSDKFIRLFNQWQLLLEQYGYTNFTKVLNAKDYGVPQNRERVFMISILNTESAIFYFPKKIALQLCLADILEEKVDKSFFLKKNDYVFFKKNKKENKIKKNYIKIAGFFGGKFAKYKLDSLCLDTTGVCNCLTIAGGKKKIKLRRNVFRFLTPKEYFSLMGVKNENSEKILNVCSANACYALAGNSIVVDVLVAIFRQLFLAKKEIPLQQEFNFLQK